MKRSIVGVALVIGLSSCDQQAELSFKLNSTDNPVPKPANSPKEELGSAAPIIGTSTKPAARTSNYYTGKALGGQSINLEANSISQLNYPSVTFVYYLGNQRIRSQANCEAGTWTTFPEKAVHTPQSEATQKMVNIVCGGKAPSSTARTGIASVFDPPSNVRISPNGPILCSIRERSTVNVYGSAGPWYYTDICGETGVIHSSQIRF